MLRDFNETLDTYEIKRRNYHKVGCNIDIAYTMFITQCIDKAHIEQSDEIMKRMISFLPASMKLQNATITQQDCLTYLKNDDVDKLVLLDTPYIGSENTCGIKGYDYDRFHKKVANHLRNANYPFLYYCRSTPPKSENTLSFKDAEHVMKMKLGYYLYLDNFCVGCISTDIDTEVILKNAKLRHIKILKNQYHRHSRWFIFIAIQNNMQ